MIKRTVLAVAVATAMLSTAALAATGTTSTTTTPTTTSATTTTTTTGTMTEKQKLSYSMGVMTGKAFKSHNVNVNPTAFSEGLNDAMTGATLKMSEKEIQTTLQNYQKQAMQKARAKMHAVASTNMQAGESFLTANKNKPGVKTTASGLQYKVITAGSGTSPKLTDVVTVNYEGKLINGKVFDSSYARHKPATFPVNGVIKGWQEALQMMKPGATWMLYIPADLAYGKMGAPGMIGPNSTLVFKVNLISVKK